jgi:DUF1680 family protein
MYAQNEDKIYANLFATSDAFLSVNNKPVLITQQNNYPWEGDLKFIVSPEATMNFSLLVRIPGWAQGEAIPSDLYKYENMTAKKVTIKINGNGVDYTMEKGYAVLNRAWKKNDVVEVTLPMEVQRVIANEKVKDDAGKIALQRGPIIYCAEWKDNNGRASTIVLPPNSSFNTTFKPQMLDGIEILESNAISVVTDEKENKVTTVKQPFVAIPYYAWANRGKGEMTVWFPEKIKDIEIISR